MKRGLDDSSETETNPTTMTSQSSSSPSSSSASNPGFSPIQFQVLPQVMLTDHRPDAKKAKTHRSQPSKVVHIRNIPPQITEVEVIQFGLIFGNIINVLNLRSKCQAFLEFEKCEEAQSMINYFANNPIQVTGRQIFVQYSNYKNLVTDPSNTNNQVAKAALDLARELHKAAQSGGANTVLRAMIQNMLYGVSLDTIYQIFSRFGPVLKIITFTKNEKFQALIQMKDATCAQAAKNALHGHNIYSSCCTLHIDYSKLNTLNVKYNNEKSRDYTNPLLPAGDVPDHLAFGPGGVLNAPLQLSMAAAGFGAPFALPAGYHLATAPAPFMISGKYLPQQTLITQAPTLLQPSNGTIATAPVPNNAQFLSHQLAYSLAQQAPSVTHTGATVINQNQTQNSVQNSIQQSQTPNSQTQTQQINTPTVQQVPVQQQQQHQNGQYILPFLQNINEDAFIMMYQA
ncbi:unnamed protein product [Brachionus calyciflorus]|uniref:RRM domain-containing protein n=1 Tax=Brachionus calyciflorus TaxID=104777 RepID=A0A813M7Q0_9BILA|nr:unnamed protein product [Brachionus calyciflorus]